MHFRAIPFFCPASNFKTHLPLTTMLCIVITEPCLGHPFAQVQSHPLGPRQLPQPGQIPSPGPRLKEFVFESLTFQTA
jgi:hypothetical protein